MWTWILVVGALLCGGAAWALRRHVAVDPTEDLSAFIDRLAAQIALHGDDYQVRGMVPGTFTMVISVNGQEVPVPLDNVHRHFLTFPDQLPLLVGQLLKEIEEVGLESPADHMFVDAAMRILPQICPLTWVFANAPAFGDSAIVHRPFGPDLAICYVIDDPWSVVFVCQAHLRAWRRSEADVFHLANQNLRRLSEADLPLPDVESGPVRVPSADGYAAARVLLIDPERAGDLLIAMPARDALYLGRTADQQQLERLMAAAGQRSGHPVSTGLYRLENQQLVPVSAPDLG
jgi:hypothetical protein